MKMILGRWHLLWTKLKFCNNPVFERSCKDRGYLGLAKANATEVQGKPQIYKNFYYPRWNTSVEAARTGGERGKDRCMQ